MKSSDLYNPLVKFILRSPVHWVMSHNTLLLTFTGRKSGQTYSTPISYARTGQVITLVTSRKHGWWKNMQAPRPVTVHMQGHPHPGTAHITPLAPPDAVAAIQRVYHGIPPERAVHLAPDIIIIKIELSA